MTGLAGIAWRTHHALIAVGALLLVLIVWPWLPGREPGEAGPLAASPAPATVPPLPALSQFAATVERPMFSPSRRPVAVAPASPVDSSLESRYRLVGVLIASGARRAMVAEGTRHVELHVGDRLEGWTVTGIEQSRVSLKSATGDAVLSIKSAGGEPELRK